MTSNILLYAWNNSKKQQLYLIIVTLLFLPLLYFTFELPKIIINDAISVSSADFSRTIFGTELGQVTFLLLLCFAFLALVLASFGTLYHLSVYKGVLAEVLLRRLRFDLYQRILRFPISHFRRTNSGEIVTMTTAEVEPIGRYLGIAFADPVLNIGTMATAMLFLFVQDWVLGLAALSLFPIQVIVIPRLQKKLNVVSRRRVLTVRKFAGQVSETLQGVRDIHSNDTSTFEMSRTGARLGQLFRIRREMYHRENFIKVLNALMTQITPFFFYSIGGYYVIKGNLTIGGLVAVIGAYREAVRPWTKLIENYQKHEDNKVKYQTLVENFNVENKDISPIVNAKTQVQEKIKGLLSVSNVTIRDGETQLLEDISFESCLPGHIALIGPAGSGKVELAQLFCQLQVPSTGEIRCGDLSFATLQPTQIGRYIGYVDQDSHVLSETWRDNLHYGLKHKPISEVEYSGTAFRERKKFIEEAEAAGNLSCDLAADWIDYEALRIAGPDDLDKNTIEIIKIIGLENTIFQKGLSQIYTQASDPQFEKRILQARSLFAERLSKSDFPNAAELFDISKYNLNATLAENLLFGHHRDETFNPDNLGRNEYVIETLKRADLYESLLDLGRQATLQMLEMFSEISADDRRIGKLSLIPVDAMTDYEALINKLDNEEMSGLREAEKNMLFSVAFKLVPADQRLGLVDTKIQESVLAARKDLLSNLPNDLSEKFNKFSADKVCEGITVQSNILFGRIADRRHKENIYELMLDVVTEVGLKDELVGLGLESSVGSSGSSLTPSERQKLVLGRALLKKPEILIVNEALSTLDPKEQSAIRGNLMSALKESSLIWVDQEGLKTDGFDQVISMKGGKIIAQRSGDGTHTKIVEDLSIKDASFNVSDEINVLRTVPLLADLSPETLKLIAFSSERHNLVAGDVIFNSGDISNGAYIVLSGQLEVSIDKDGSKKVIGSVDVGDLVGEVGILSNVPRTATVSAVDNASVLLLTREIFTDLIKTNSSVNEKVIGLLSERLASATIELSQSA